MEKKIDLEKLLKKYCGKYHKNNIKAYEDFPEINTMAKILNRFHTHAEIVNDQDPEQIVFRQEDIIRLLTDLGFKPSWGNEKKQLKRFLKKIKKANS